MKSHIFFSIAFILFTSFCFAQNLQDKLPLDPEVTVGILDNGLRYYIRYNKRPEKRAELRLAVNAGSVLEDDDQLGLAHLAEHMAFNGTKNFHKLEIVNYLERIGMRFGPDVNAYTSFDETVYMIQVPTDSPLIVRKGFQILEEWAHNVLMEPEEIDKERGVVIEEWRLGRGAEMRMRDKQFPILFKNSRYAERLPIGKKEILESFPHHRIQQFYKDWYRPDLMAVIAVGDFDKNEIETIIKERFSNIPSAKSPRERTLYDVPDHTETLFAIASDPEATVSLVSVNYKRNPQPPKTVSDYRRQLVERLYNEMLNKRLEELTKQPEPPFINAYSSSRSLVRTKEVYSLTAVVKDNEIERGLEALLTEAARVQQHGFTVSELERQKKTMMRFTERQYQEREKTESRIFASQLVNHFLKDEPMPGIAYIVELNKKYIPTITLLEINNVATQLMTEKNKVISVNVPEKQGVKIPTEVDLQKVLNVVTKKEIKPYEDKVEELPLVETLPKTGKIIEEVYLKDLNTTQWKLSNGVKVVLKHTDFKNDEVLLTAFSRGGHSLVPDNNYIAATTAASIIQEGGVGKFDYITLQKMLQGKIVNVTPYISELDEGFSANCSPSDLETMFQLIYLYTTSPRADSSAFISYQTRTRGFLQNRNARPESALEDTLQVTLTQYHFRHRPFTEPLLNEMSLKESFNIFKDRFADCGDFTFIIVGNFNMDEIKPLILTYLGGLPAKGRKENWKDVGVRTPKGKIEKIVKKGIEPKSAVRIVFSGVLAWSRENRHDLQSMISVLRIKLREVLREDKGGVYGVGVGATTIHFPREEYRITINFGCAPERVDELTKAVFEQIDSLKNFGTTDEYIQKVKEAQRREWEINSKENRFWLNSLRSAYYDEEDPLLILKYNELLERVTKENVQRTAKKYLDTGNLVKVVLYPAEK